MQTLTSPIIALDVGERRIGLAIVRPPVLLASPLPALTMSDDAPASIAEIVKQEAAQAIVVGLPRGLNGQTTAQTTSTQKFADKLRDASVTIHFQDEAVTSIKARETLALGKKPYNKGEVDSLAAVYILEDFIRDNLRSSVQ